MVWAVPSLCGLLLACACPALWRQLMHCGKRRARIVMIYSLISSARPNARDFAERVIMEYTARSLRLDVGCLNDGRPARNFVFQEHSQCLLTASRLFRKIVGQFDQALARAFVIERPVQGVGEPVQDRLRRSLRREQRKPSRR